ncbi:MAG: hypothetical protein AB8B87_21375 [Granulosicoccus sp.]
MLHDEFVTNEERLMEPVIERRAPASVMRLARLGSLHQSRLSFMRILLRRMQSEQWTFSCPEFVVDERGVGRAVMCAHGPENTYSLVAFFHDLPAYQRSDRVIAEAWDATFTLVDGIPTEEDIKRLSRNVPLQEAGRVSERELSLSRANRSVRLWEHVVDSLANGEQPDTEYLHSVGYLMRTTAVYGSGKFGAADREVIEHRPEFKAPFQVEMLTVYLIRALTKDLVQAVASAQAKRLGRATAAVLEPTVAQSLGIGNSTGLGMAPFLLNHPVLLNNWLQVREEALVRVRRLPSASADEVDRFRELLSRGIQALEEWKSNHPLQQEKLVSLKSDARRLLAYVNQADFQNDYPWNRLQLWAEKNLDIDAQEYLVSMLFEPYGELVDNLADELSANEDLHLIDGGMQVSSLCHEIRARYDWALTIDWNLPDSHNYVWYTSAEKLEPRLGERQVEALDAYEQPLSPARDISALYDALVEFPSEETIARFLIQQPEHRHAVRRVQLLRDAPYGEIRDNTIGAELLPIDLLRCKLAFFGATRFDPRSDRWVRICLFDGAPYPQQLANSDAQYWPYPLVVGSTSHSNV